MWWVLPIDIIRFKFGQQHYSLLRLLLYYYTAAKEFSPCSLKHQFNSTNLILLSYLPIAKLQLFTKLFNEFNHCLKKVGPRSYLIWEATQKLGSYFKELCYMARIEFLKNKTLILIQWYLYMNKVQVPFYGHNGLGYHHIILNHVSIFSKKKELLHQF